MTQTEQTQQVSRCTLCPAVCPVVAVQSGPDTWRSEYALTEDGALCPRGSAMGDLLGHRRRILGAFRRRDGQLAVPLDWTRLCEELKTRLGEAGRLAAVLSPFLTVEEAYLLAKLIRQYDPRAPLVLGPIPAGGDDERFPNGFTIAAEKCPNRRGVEAIIAHFAGRVTPFDELPDQIGRGGIRGLWVSGGYKNDWIDEPTAPQLSGLELLVVQDLFPSPLSERANYELPAAAFPERDGSYVNRADRLQSVRWAIRPPGAVRPEGSLLWELLGMEGLYDARAVLSEVAAEIPYFNAAGGPVPEVGIDLKVNLLANTPADRGPSQV